MTYSGLRGPEIRKRGRQAHIGVVEERACDAYREVVREEVGQPYPMMGKHCET